jgi:Tfp pilus assembly protein PilF
MRIEHDLAASDLNSRWKATLPEITSTPMGDSSSRSQLVTCLGAVIVCALTVFIYRPAWHGGFIWDDDRYVINNHLLIAPDGLRRIWLSLDAPSQYFPLTYTLLRIERSLWGLNPTGYHWVNLFFHIANALLVWIILARLEVRGSWLAAAIFALHPVQAESVAWISELKNVLMAFFFLLTVLTWIGYVDPEEKRRPVLYVAAILFYVLALAAKSTACTLPAALLLIPWWKKQPITRKAILEIVPFIVLAIGVGLIAIWWEKYHQGTRVLVSLAPMERLLIASRAIWFYLGKIFWPSNLTFIYPQWNINVSDPAAYFWLIATGLAGIVIYLTRRFFGRNVAVAVLFFVATLSPLLGFIMLYTFRYTFVADHYQYLACIGPIAAAASGFMILTQKIRNGQWIGWSGGLAITVCLSFLTWRQSVMYRDLETLWRTTIAKDPKSWVAYNNLGVVEQEKGNVDDAIDKYEQALRFHDNYPEAHYNLGSALLLKGDPDHAIQQCEQALRLQPNEPDAHVVLGNAFMAKNDVDQASKHYRRALKIRPDDLNAHYNLGIALQQKGELEQAAREFEKANKLESGRRP